MTLKSDERESTGDLGGDDKNNLTGTCEDSRLPSKFSTFLPPSRLCCYILDCSNRAGEMEK
jgi:hypothetical protein